MRRYVLLLGVVRFFFVPIQLVASLSLFDRRKVLNTATTTILSSSWSTPANSEWRDPLYTDDSRLWIPIPATKINRISRISIPKIGYSLYNTNPDQAETCVQLAIQAGCRHFDVATQYGSNEQVGRVLRSFVTDGRNGAQKSTYTRQRRQELFISHKVSNEEQSTKIANVKQTIKRQLHQLSVDYLDLCSIHSPLTDPDRRLATYQAILELQQEGIVKAIGVCNYGVHPLNEIIHTRFAPPSVIQLVLSPFNQHKEVVRWARDHGSVMSCNSWSKLSSVQGPQKGWTILADIAKTKGMTKAQVLVRWAFQHDYLSVPRSASTSKIERLAIQENSYEGVKHFLLSQTEMDVLDSLDEQLPLGRLGITDGCLASDIIDENWDPTLAV